MKIFKFFVALVGFASFCSCSTDWGQMDEPAGNQTYPTREQVAQYNFEYDEETTALSDMDKTYAPAGKPCEVVMDDSINSNVLHLDSGYVRIANPLNSVTLQDGAGIAMWVNLSQEALEKAIFAFGYEDLDSTKFYFTPNAELVYTKPGQLESLNLDENNPSTVKTGALAADSKWHFLAVQIGDDGYQVYVDGELKANETGLSPKYDTDFDYKTLIEHINKAPYLYIGAGADTLMAEARYDDITLFRNHMEQKDWNKKLGGTEGGEVDNKVYIPVGAEDCSSAWWTVFSDYYTLSAEQTFHTQFINHTSGGGNWNNWNLCVSTEAERNATGYAEYFVIRSDLYGWGDCYSSGTWTSEGYPSDDAGWTQFRADMEGAVVDLTVARSGATVKVTAVAKCTNGTTYTETFTTDCGDGTQNINTFLIVDGSYLQIDPDETYIGNYYESGTKMVGSTACDAGFWTTWSDYYSLTMGGDALRLEFTNNTDAAANYDNWILAVTTQAERNADGYTEYLILRSDAYGWGTMYDQGTMTQSFDWTTYPKDMNGAKVIMSLSLSSDGTFYMKADQTKADGTAFPDYTFELPGIPGSVNVFLTLEKACLDFSFIGYYPYSEELSK